MRLFVLILLGSLSLVAACAEPQQPAAPAPLYPSSDASGAPLLAVFEGRVPCLATGCEKTKVAIAFYRGGTSQSYWLATVDVGDDDPRRIVQGTWRATAGVKDYPQAQVYELDAQAPAVLRRLWRVSDGVLLPLDDASAPRVGNASWGYMLSRAR